MKIVRVLFAATVPLLAAASLAQTVKDTIKDHYSLVSELTVHKAKIQLAKAMMARSTSNFVSVDRLKNTFNLDVTTRMNSDQIDSVKKFNSVTNKLVNYKVMGNKIICTIQSTYDVISKENEDHVRGSSISEDTWTQTLTGWKIMKTKVIAEKQIVNGKVVEPSF